jgi:hypothetical protein
VGIAISQVDAVLVLLTPEAVKSKYVEWEWETSFTMEKFIIPLLILPCTVPNDLARLHYHNLSQTINYSRGFASLIRDLIEASTKMKTKKHRTLNDQLQNI